jgi:hypothetical protein
MRTPCGGVVTEQDPKEAADELAEKIDERRLMEIIHTLPRYDAVEEDEALAIFGDVLNALREYIETYQRARARPITLATIRDSLDRLDGALSEIAAAWAAADDHTKQRVYQAMGEQPFADSELRPLNERVGADSWTRGAYRIVKFRENAAHLAAVVATMKSAASATEQRRKEPVFPGIDNLTERLAATFTQHTHRPLNLSRNQGGVVAFIVDVAEVLPPQVRPSEWMIFASVRRIVEGVADRPS